MIGYRGRSGQWGKSALSGLLPAPAFQVVLAALVMLAPALVNGFPFWFFDTANYLNVGHSIVSNIEKLFHLSGATHPVPNIPGSAPTMNGVNPWLYQIGTRSPLYSAMLYIAATASSYWVIAIAQALCGAWLISACARALGLTGPRPLLTIVASLTLMSTLPYFAGELMPDVFAGYAFIALLLPGVSADRLSALERSAIALLASASITIHNTIVVLAFLLALVVAGMAWIARIRGRELRRLIAWVSAPLALALCFNLAYGNVVALTRGAAPTNPPYLMARVLADGPGQSYLREACAAQVHYELCKFADRPLGDVNQFLWSTNPNVGVFMLASADSKLRLINEERAFVAQTILHYPIAEIGAMAANAAQLLPRNDVGGELSLSRHSWEQMRLGELAPRENAAARASLAFRGAYPFLFVDIVNAAALALAAGFISWRLTRADALSALRPASTEAIEFRILVATAVALLLWILSNAALCGAISGVFARYQARVLWLVPLFALLVFLRFGSAAKHTPGPPTRTE